jgi:rhodanese-related sulfurtransferase
MKEREGMRKIGPLCMSLVAVAAFLWLTPAWAQKPPWKEIQPEQLHQMLSQKADLLLINTMSYIECRDHSIPGSICIPSGTFDEQTDRLPPDKQRKLVYYCESNLCLRSNQCAEKAIKLGYTDVSVLKNGLPGWKTAGYETVSQERIPRKAIPSVKPALLKRWMGEEKSLFILDIRSNEAFREGHIDGAVSIPFSRLEEQYHNLPFDRLIIVVDERGFRSFIAACYLARKGFEMTRLFGGMERWQRWLSVTKEQPAKKRN